MSKTHGNKTKLAVFLAPAILVVLAVYFFSFHSPEGETSSKPGNAFKPFRVAHAGGGLNHMTYTNSLEALSSNYQKGHRYFELDFSWTKDHKLVCLHDWKSTFQRFFGYVPETPLTLKEFINLARSKPEFTSCTLESLADWMKYHPDAYLITDNKSKNLQALTQILKTLPNAHNRVIPQIYHPQNFIRGKKMGFNQMIWTLYAEGKMSNDKIMQWVKTFPGPFAITMPPYRAKTDLPKRLKRLKIPSYVHTINSEQTAQEYQNTHGLTEVYTDYLPPKDASEIPWDFTIPLADLPPPGKRASLTKTPADPSSKTAKPQSSFCPIKKWGPKKLTAGTPFNPQPDGSSAFWIVTDCAPPGAVAYLGSRPLKTVGGPPQLAALVAPGTEPDQPGTLTFSLKDPNSGTKQEIGTVRVYSKQEE